MTSEQRVGELRKKAAVEICILSLKWLNASMKRKEIIPLQEGMCVPREQWTYLHCSKGDLR